MVSVRNTYQPIKSDNATRILCLILTSNSNTQKMQAVNDTWAKRCDKYLFVYSNLQQTTSNEDIVLNTSVAEGRDHLTAKVRYAFEHAHKINNGDFDWILKCDDDTYVIMENLKYLLSLVDPEIPGYLGFHMKTSSTMRNGYMSGGAGYVINSRALHNLVTIGFQNGACKKDGGNEDEEMGLCLANSSVVVLNSVDITGKESFHAGGLVQLLSPPHRYMARWIEWYSWNKRPLYGHECCSQYSVAFHYVTPTEQYLFEHLLYHTSIYRHTKGGNSTHADNLDKNPMFYPHVVKSLQ
ncbi:glycoprotein-N-acetylgalactosamine 3-beta-galactosyltransferase [Mactra antiquata]